MNMDKIKQNKKQRTVLRKIPVSKAYPLDIPRKTSAAIIKDK